MDLQETLFSFNHLFVFVEKKFQLQETSTKKVQQKDEIEEILRNLTPSAVKRPLLNLIFCFVESVQFCTSIYQ